MSNLPMRLYVDAPFTSPYALSVFVTLREKGLPFEVHTLDLDALEQQAPAFAGLSVTQRVPTLAQDGFALSESSAITEYLEDVFPQVPVYPGSHASVHGRGRFRRGCAATCCRSARNAPRWWCFTGSNTARYQLRPKPLPTN